MEAEAGVNPTENPDKVKQALNKLFSGEVQITGELDRYGSAKLSGTGRGSLDRFKMIIQRDRIRAAARSQLFKGLMDNEIVVFLNKQVAHAGHVSFSAPEGESPLGPIKLRIKTPNPIGVIDWLTGGVTSERKDREVSKILL